MTFFLLKKCIKDSPGLIAIFFVEVFIDCCTAESIASPSSCIACFIFCKFDSYPRVENVIDSSKLPSLLSLQNFSTYSILGSPFSSVFLISDSSKRFDIYPVVFIILLLGAFDIALFIDFFQSILSASSCSPL